MTTAPTPEAFLVLTACVVVVAWVALGLDTARRSGTFRRRVVCTVALFSLVILRLPVLLGGRSVLLPAVAAVFICATLLMPVRLPRGASAAIVAAFAAVLGLELVRGAMAGAYSSLSYAVSESVTYGALILFGYAFVAAARKDREMRLSLLAMAPAVYAATNLVLFPLRPAREIAGSVALGESATVLQSLGIQAERVIFPMATSINLFSVVCAAGLAAAVVLTARPSVLPRWFTGAGALACAVCLLLGDSRGPLLIGAAVSLFFALRRRSGGSWAIAYLIPALPLLLVLGLRVLGSSELAEELSRSGNDITTATGRTELWQNAWRFLSSWPPESLFGWGAYGHVTSGASLSWYMDFRGTADPIRVQSHSLVLQTIFDSGWFGLAVLVGAAATTFTSLARSASSSTTALVASLAVVLLCGVTEVAGTYLSQEALATMLLTMGAGLALAPRVVSDGRERARRAERPDPMYPRRQSAGARAGVPAAEQEPASVKA